MVSSYEDMDFQAEKPAEEEIEDSGELEFF
jgi:hypothetical protein